MNSAQLSADVTVLSASLYRLKQQMGAERFTAAQAALQQQKEGRRQSGTASREGDASPSAHTTAGQRDDATDVLTLARAAGIGRYGQ